MRLILVFVALVSFGPALRAQTAAAPQPAALEVEVVKFSWSKERLNWQHNPFGGPNENFHEMQMRARAEKRLTDAKRGNSADIKKIESDAKADVKISEARRENESAEVPRYVFLYRTSIRNGSTKAIKEIDWDYIFYDAGTREELGRRQFTSVQTIGPGKSKELSFMVPTPPTRRISVNSLDKKERTGLEERVVVVRITYADGSVWQLQ